MSKATASEEFLEEFCRAHGVPCSRVPTGDGPTPDFELELRGTGVVCEVKQIDLNPEDRREIAQIRSGVGTARYLPNRFRQILKDVSRQLKAAAASGRPTLLVVYDNTPFKEYTEPDAVLQAMFGRNSITISLPTDPAQPSMVSPPFFGADRGLGPGRNTAISAIAILDGQPQAPKTLRVYHNPYAVVRLDPSAFGGLPVTQPVLPDTTEIRL